MKKKYTPLGDIVRSVKINVSLVIALAVILVIAAFVYIPTVKQELGVRPSEAGGLLDPGFGPGDELTPWTKPKPPDSSVAPWGKGPSDSWDFTISMSPTSATVEAKDEVNFVVTTTRSGGYVGDIYLDFKPLYWTWIESAVFSDYTLSFGEYTSILTVTMKNHVEDSTVPFYVVAEGDGMLGDYKYAHGVLDVVGSPHGNLIIVLDHSSPLKKLLAGNSNKNLLTTWRFVANPTEAIRIDDISIESGSTSVDDLKIVYIYADRDHTGTQVDPLTNLIAQGVQTGTDTTYYMNPDTNLRPVVPANEYIRIYAYADMPNVDGTAVTNGDIVRLNIDDVSADINCTGLSSGISFDPSGSDGRDGAPHQLYESYPIVTLSPLSPAGDLILGPMQTVAIYRITAHPAGDITIDNDDSNALTVDFSLFVNNLDGSPIFSELWDYTTNTKLASPDAVNWIGTPYMTLSEITFTFEDEALIVPAGGYKDIAIKLDTLQWDTAGNYITVVLLDDAKEDFIWGINGTGAHATGDISFRPNIWAHTLVYIG